MIRPNINLIPEPQRRAPGCRGHTIQKNISETTGAAEGGHPFDVDLVRLPAGAKDFPFYTHYVQWEMYIFLSGTGELEVPEQTIAVGPGEAVIFPPGVPLAIKNTGTLDLVFYLVADQSPTAVMCKPEQGHWFINPQHKGSIMSDASCNGGGD